MKRTHAGRTISIILMFVVITLSLALFMRGIAIAGQPPSNSSCDSPEHHQFDFTVGDWDIYDFDHPGKITAHIRVERILDGCVLHEIYSDPSGSAGESFSVYDATRRIWHQTWVTNSGKLLVIEGTFDGHQMVLSGEQRQNGQRVMVRGTWQPISGGVRETAVTSADGKSWTPWFDIVFHPRRP